MPLSEFYPQLKGWTPVQNVNPTALPQLPTPEVQVSPYLRTVLPLPMQYAPDTLKQSNRPGLSSYRVTPQSPSSVPAINAAAKSAVTSSIAQAISNIQSAVSLVVPSIFTPVTQTENLPGPLQFGLAPENPATVLAAPVASLSSLEAINNVAGETTNSYTNTAIPNSQTSWGLFVSMSTNPAPAPSGWTDLGGQAVLYGKSITGTSPVTVSLSPGGGLINSVSTLAIFSGSLVSSVQARQATPTSTGSGTLAFTSSNTAGNTIVVVLQAQNSSTPITLGASDSNGNTYETLSQTIASFDSVHGVPACSQLVLVAANIVAGANTVTYEFNGVRVPFAKFQVFIFEVSPLSAGAGIPLFRNLTSSDIPSINATKISSGQVSLSNGGSAANLQATGGPHQFVKQSSAGAAFTVGQPDFSDLAGATGQVATSYNGVALVSGGLPSEVATVDLTAQTAAKTTTTLYAVPATGAGQYELSWNAKVTTADAVSSTLGVLTITYTDPDGVVQTITAAAQNKNGVIETSDTGNSTTTAMIGLYMMLNCKASTNITYAMAYASNTAGTMAYNLHMKLKAL